MKVSVVVPTLNSERTIGIAARPSLSVADEVIVIGVAKGDYVVNLDADMYFSENFRGFKEKVIALGEITMRTA